MRMRKFSENSGLYGGKMKIALIQSRILWEDKDANISGFREIVSTHPDVDLFLLPEMSFTGFSMNTALTAESRRETASVIREIAAANSVSIGFGWVRRTDQKCENVYSIIGKNGALISEYVKIHPFSWSGEDKYFTGGNRIPVFRMNDIPFAAFICYDLRFPELFRAVCKDVHAVILPANWPGKRSEHWKILLRARAIENRMYVFAVNCVGMMNDVYYSGDSCVIDPNGEVLMSLSDQEGVLIYDYHDDTEAFRETFPVLSDIRPDFSVSYEAYP